MKKKLKSSSSNRKKSKRKGFSFPLGEEGVLHPLGCPGHGGVGVKVNRVVNKGLKAVSLSISRWTNRKS